MPELADDLYAEIQRLSANGDDLAEGADYRLAVEAYWAAFDLLPEPKFDWDAATWLLAAIGDANFLAGDYEAARDNLINAMCCPDAVGNPFLHLRKGQAHFELGELDRAADDLARAYLADGTEIFANDDPKYLAFVKARLSTPPGGWND